MPFVTTDEAANLLGVTKSRVRAMIRKGLLKSIKGGTRDHLIDEAELATYASRPRPAGRPRTEEAATKLGITPEQLREKRRLARLKAREAASKPLNY